MMVGGPTNGGAYPTALVAAPHMPTVQIASILYDSASLFGKNRRDSMLPFAARAADVPGMPGSIFCFFLGFQTLALALRYRGTLVAM